MAGEIPLSDSHRHALAVHLALLERDLWRMREALENAPPSLTMTRFIEPLDHTRLHSNAIRALERASQQIRTMANDLTLAPREESVARARLSALDVRTVELFEMRPPRVFAYGEMPAPCAEYLDREVGQLQDRIEELCRVFRRRRPKNPLPT